MLIYYCQSEICMRNAKRTVFSKHSVGDEPIWDKSLESLPKVLNWYSHNKTQDDAKEYILAYAKHINLPKADVKLLSTTKERVNTSIAWLCRMLMNSEFNSTEFKCRIDLELSRLISTNKQKETLQQIDIPKRQAVNVQENIKIQLSEQLGEINFQLDSMLDCIRRDIEPSFSLNNWLRDNKVSAIQTKNISNYFKNNIMPELLEAQAATCEQLTEAYSFLTAKQLKSYISVIEKFIADCDEQHIIKKQMLVHNRTPRKRVISPLKQVAKLKYLKEYESLKSIPPTKIVGAKALVIYNPEARLVIYYECDNNHGLAVKGCTLLNYDITKTICKVLRKPNDILPTILSEARVAARNCLRDVKSKNKVASGRLNDKFLILKAF